MPPLLIMWWLTEYRSNPAPYFRLNLLLAFFGGALAVAAFAPLGWVPLLIPGLLWLFWLWLQVGARRGFWLGYAYGLGLMSFGISWLQVSLAQFANVQLFASVLYTAGFIAFIALYFGLTGWLMVWLARRLPVVAQYLLVMPAVWVLVEWLRGWLLTGFPWLSLGYALVDTPLAGFAPVLGVYGLSWLALLWLGAVGLVLRGRYWSGLLILAVPLLGWALSGVRWWLPLGESFRVSLIQANIQQQYKWDPDLFTQSMRRHLQLTDQSRESDLIIWPETAITAMAYEVKSSLLDPLEIQARQHGAEILVGVPWMDLATGRYYNTLLNLGGEGGHYAKRHLVPFGEYAPLAWLLKPFVDSLGVELSDFTPGDGGQPLLKVGGLSAGISICYEDAFGDEVRQALPEAAYLINVTNDGWFGETLAPYQHLQIARLRALETGRYLLRATNTGISAIIGPDGKLLRYSTLMKEVAVHGQVQPLQGSTPYVRWGGLPLLSLLAIGLVWSRVSARTQANV